MKLIETHLYTTMSYAQIMRTARAVKKLATSSKTLVQFL